MTKPARTDGRRIEVRPARGEVMLTPRLPDRAARFSPIPGRFYFRLTANLAAFVVQISTTGAAEVGEICPKGSEIAAVGRASRAVICHIPEDRGRGGSANLPPPPPPAGVGVPGWHPSPFERTKKTWLT